MKKISYNLAAYRNIDGRAFALRASLLVLASLLLAGVAVFNLARQHDKDSAGKSANSLIGQQIAERMRLSQQQAREIAAWKKELARELASANRLIERKSFSFTTRLDFLEKAFGPGIRIRHLSLVNDGSGRVGMTLAAQSLKELFALYKKLAPYGLVIANETQTASEFQSSLSFRMSNEKI
jgi:hypothetical protein